MTLTILLLILAFAILIKGGHCLVIGSVSVAKNYPVSELATGLPIVAFGTSAPELVVNTISSAKGYNDVAIGNITGSNIFKIFLIPGVSSLIATINYSRSFHVDISILIASSVLLFAFMFCGK